MLRVPHNNIFIVEIDAASTGTIPSPIEVLIPLSTVININVASTVTTTLAKQKLYMLQLERITIPYLTGQPNTFKITNLIF